MPLYLQSSSVPYPLFLPSLLLCSLTPLLYSSTTFTHSILPSNLYLPFHYPPPHSNSSRMHILTFHHFSDPKHKSTNGGPVRQKPQKDEVRLQRRKEQNRAAQRAFRERKERHVLEVSDIRCSGLFFFFGLSWSFSRLRLEYMRRFVIICDHITCDPILLALGSALSTHANYVLYSSKNGSLSSKPPRLRRTRRTRTSEICSPVFEKKTKR
jgi:hypothetical protein